MQFNLLHLDHGELLLESALCTVRYLDDASLGGGAASPAPERGEQEGRLWLTTRAVMFEPRVSDGRPILRFLFKQMPGEPSADIQANAATFRVRKVIEIRKYQPYTHVDLSTPRGVTVALKHTKVSKLSLLMQELWSISQKSRHPNDAIEESLLKPIVEPRLLEPFDRSRLIDFREEIIFPARHDAVACVDKVEPLVNVPGCLVLTRERIYFQHSRCNNLSGSRQCVVIEVADVLSVYKRRYMMQQRGLEMRLTNDRSILIVFRDGTEQRDDFHKSLVELNPSQLARTMETRLQDLTRQWQSGGLDNFSYLCALNEEADRSANDLTQYPVFPWVLADYTSPMLDLDNPATFRDLAKPIGALDEKRLAQFKERFESMDPNGDPPPFLYGTHYSTPGFVLFYLIRERPEEMLRLQSGKFDAPDRMFHSVADAWNNVLTNPADVKELIPEFYSGTGDFLLNLKRLDLGKKAADGKRIGDVELPPWANNSAREFVKKMRAALESDYVSNNLHLWIDLIFGCDQRSIDRNNVFYHLTYQDASAIFAHDMDEATRKGIEVQIMEFGQTPKQLFTRPHPKRNDVVQSVLGADTFIPKDIGVDSSTPMLAALDVLLEAERNKVFPHEEEEDSVLAHKKKWPFTIKHKFSSTEWIGTLSPQSYAMDACVSSSSSSSALFYTPCRDGSLAFFSEAKITRRVRLSKLALSCVTECPGGEDVIAGSWDNALYRYSISTGRVRARIENAHDDSVNSCFISGGGGRYMVTGGSDAAVKVWSSETCECLCGFFEHDAPVSAAMMSEDERLVLSGDKSGYIRLFDPRVGHFSVWMMDFSLPDRQRNGDTKLAWVSTRSKILVSSPSFGVKLLDFRKNSVVAEVQSPSWLPQALLTDGDKVLVGDSTGRVTLSTLDKLEQVPFESNVIIRMPTKYGDRYCSAAVSAMSVGPQHLLVCSDQGAVGICELPKEF